MFNVWPWALTLKNNDAILIQKVHMYHQLWQSYIKQFSLYDIDIE